MTVRLTICSSCKFSEHTAFDPTGRTGGELLAEIVGRKAKERSADIAVIGHDCLWACRHSCSTLIQMPDKTGYLAGRFAPDEQAADALLDWCLAYADSAEGEVEFHKWPDGMKGHFIARLPVPEAGR